MADFKLSDELRAELEQLERMAEAGVAGNPPASFLAEFVKLQRGMRQWKQETLASFADVSLTTIQRIERGEPVSPDSLDRVAVALGYEKGDFTEPRVPLGQKQAAEKFGEFFAKFEGMIPVQVRPLRTQLQAASVARCECYLVDGSHLEADHSDDLHNLREWLDLTTFILGREDDRSFGRERPVRRRELYNDILKATRDLERCANAVALCGTYTAETNHPLMPTTTVGLISFFPKATDPAAVKRKVLLLPKSVDLRAGLQAFMAEAQ